MNEAVPDVTLDYPETNTDCEAPSIDRLVSLGVPQDVANSLVQETEPETDTLVERVEAGIKAVIDRKVEYARSILHDTRQKPPFGYMPCPHCGRLVEHPGEQEILRVLGRHEWQKPWKETLDELNTRRLPTNAPGGCDRLWTENSIRIGTCGLEKRHRKQVRKT